jgi:NADH:ubiquinone oxidoreductase subunit 2 (subunit N)
VDYLEQLGRIAPEIALTVTAMVVLVFDLVSKGRDSRRSGFISLAGLAVTGWMLLSQWSELVETGSQEAFGMVRIDLFGTFFKLFTVGSLAVVMLFVMSDRRERKNGIGEYYFLLLGAAIGAFFMVSTNNLLLMMIALELLSLASYSLAGFHKGDRKSAEASLKYVIFGALSAGVMIYGISLLYGLTGTLDLTLMGSGGDGVVGLGQQFAQSPVPVAVAVVLVFAGFAYKVSVVPFHFWTPDVYEGAPTPVTTFLAVGSKAAGFAVLLRFVGQLFMSNGADAAVTEYGVRISMLLAILLVLAGFAYKVSVVPFHFWTPDVYEGAPTPVTTFLAVASKAAGFAVFLRFIGALFLVDGVEDTVAAYGDRIGFLLAILAAVTMTLGNLSALRQTNLKRMLAYSSIAHAGYALMGVACMTEGGFSASIFYLAAYYFMNLGAFGFLLYFEGVTGSDEVESLEGLGWRYPLVSCGMVVLLVSLTGLPPTVGFYGKLLLFKEGLASGLGWLVFVLALNSVVSLFYYFRVVKALFLAPEAEKKATIVQPVLAGLITILAVFTVVTGLFNRPLEEWSHAAPASLGIPTESGR